jgi:hypothetical protein
MDDQRSDTDAAAPEPGAPVLIAGDDGVALRVREPRGRGWSSAI